MAPKVVATFLGATTPPAILIDGRAEGVFEDDDVATVAPDGAVAFEAESAMFGVVLVCVDAAGLIGLHDVTGEMEDIAVVVPHTPVQYIER